MRPIALLLLSFLTFVFGIAGDASAKRVALVIANSEYEHTGKLLNPKNDASAIAEALQRLNFDSVTMKENLDYRGLRLALKDFSNQSAGSELALVYFAGHGIEVSGQNYLIPTDAKLDAAGDIEYEGIPLPSVLSSVEGAKRLKLVILDACRNNPFRSRMVSRSGTRSIGRGLARVEPESNTMVAFAAKEGTVALDGDGKHSPYANALLSMVEEPGVEIGFLFRRVRDRVLEVTGKRQEPFTYGSLGGTPIYLKPPQAKTASVEKSAVADERFASLRKELDELKRQFQGDKPSDNNDQTGTRAQSTPETGTATAGKSSTQADFSSTSGDAAADNTKQQKIASAEPAPSTAETASSTALQTSDNTDNDRKELVSGIQTELARLGCAPGPVDGYWGLRTSAALSNLNTASNQNLNTANPDKEALTALRGMNGTICKAPAPQIVAPAPNIQKPVAKKAYVQPQKKAYTAPAKKTQKKKEYWGGEDTRIDCEDGKITDKCFR